MKKLILPIMILMTMITNFVNLQNSNNKHLTLNNAPRFELKVAVNNQTSNVGVLQLVCFYLDITVNGIAYNNNNFDNDPNLQKFNKKPIYGQKGLDIFIVNPNTEATLITTDLDPSLDFATIDFSFGTFYSPLGHVWYHAQLTMAYKYQYNFYKTYVNTTNNGTKVVINANGSDGANSANWGFHYYKF